MRNSQRRIYPRSSDSALRASLLLGLIFNARSKLLARLRRLVHFLISQSQMIVDGRIVGRAALLIERNDS